MISKDITQFYKEVTRESVEKAKADTREKRLQFFFETGVAIGEEGHLIRPVSKLVH